MADMVIRYGVDGTPYRQGPRKRKASAAVTFGRPTGPVDGYATIRDVRLRGAIIGRVYGIADNPAAPTRPTSYLLLIHSGTPSIRTRFDRLEEVREEVARELS